MGLVSFCFSPARPPCRPCCLRSKIGVPPFSSGTASWHSRSNPEWNRITAIPLAPYEDKMALPSAAFGWVSGARDLDRDRDKQFPEGDGLVSVCMLSDGCVGPLKAMMLFAKFGSWGRHRVWHNLSSSARSNCPSMTLGIWQTCKHPRAHKVAIIFMPGETNSETRVDTPIKGKILAKSITRRLHQQN